MKDFELGALSYLLELPVDRVVAVVTVVVVRVALHNLVTDLDR